MIRAGYSRCEYDSCVYFLQGKDPTYLLLYVDDMLIAARSKAQVQKVKAQLKREFDMKDLGEARKILGMEITRDRSADALWLSQKNHILKVLERFNMTEARPVTTLLAGHFRLSSEQCPQSPGEEDEMSRVPYASAVGSLMYAMVCTRPDLAFAVSSVSRFMSNPGKQHWEAVKWIFRYLRGTAKLGLEFRKLRRRSLGHFRALSMRILVETLISEGPRRVMYSHWLSVSLVGRRSCKIQWLFRLLRWSTWLRLRHQRKLCG